MVVSKLFKVHGGEGNSNYKVGTDQGLLVGVVGGDVTESWCCLSRCVRCTIRASFLNFFYRT